MFAGVLCLLFCTFLLRSIKTGDKTYIFMLDIGQGDSFLVQAANGKQLLIDGGRDAKVLSELSKVLPRGDRSIDVVIATHPDADHIGGLPLVLSRYKVGMFITSDVIGSTATYLSLIKAVQDHHIPAYYARHGMTVVLDDSKILPTTFSIVFPDRPTTNWETNTASVVGRLDVGPQASGTSALFTGDSPISVEHFLTMAIPQDIDVDVLKLGHHGSKTSSSDEFLKATSPSLALISAGVGNSYGHPHQETLDRLSTLHIPWVSTQQHGIVELSTDGSTWIEKDEK